MADITDLLHAAADKRPGAESALLDAVYAELQRLSRLAFRREREDHTLQPTALVHEAYLRLMGRGTVRFENRGQFFTAAARVMRHILIDHARARMAGKRTGLLTRVELDFDSIPVSERPEQILRLDALLEQLAAVHDRPARVVELRFYAGLGVADVAEVLDISEKTVKRDWALARAWLEKELRP